MKQKRALTVAALHIRKGTMKERKTCSYVLVTIKTLIKERHDNQHVKNPTHILFCIVCANPFAKNTIVDVLWAKMCRFSVIVIRFLSKSHIFNNFTKHIHGFFHRNSSAGQSFCQELPREKTSRQEATGKQLD